MRLFSAALLVCLFAAPCIAGEYKVDPARSKLTFSATQSGNKIEGGFSQFTAAIHFEPGAGTGHVVLDIPLGSLVTGDEDAKENLPTESWFNLAQFPTAKYEGDFTRTGDSGNQYAMQGKLTLRGVTKGLNFAFTLSPDGTAWHAAGTATLSRKDFAIGQGRWASDEWIKYPVDVKFDVYTLAQ